MKIDKYRATKSKQKNLIFYTCRRATERIVATLIFFVLSVQPASAITMADGGDVAGSTWGLKWWDYEIDDQGNIENISADATSNDNKWTPVDDTNFYDPNKKTIIYFHGWQPSSVPNEEEEDFIFVNLADDTATETINTLRNWKDDNFNVGVFYWTPWADDSGNWLDLGGQSGGGEASSAVSFNVNAGEGKIWSSNAHTRMRFKFKEQEGGPVIESKLNIGSPDGARSYADRIKLKKHSFEGADRTSVNPAYDYEAWHNLSSRSQILSALRYIVADGTYDQLEEVELVRSNSSNCPDFVRKLICDGSGSVDDKAGWACDTTTEDQITVQEVFEPLVCEVPSLGAMAAEMVGSVLQKQINEDVRFVGHSLGNQMAIHTATRIWWMHRSSTFSNYAGLPKRLDLLDPYYSSDKKSYLTNRYLGNIDDDSDTSKGWRQNNLRTTWGKATQYVKYLRRMSDSLPLNESFRFPVTYLDTSILSDFKPSGNPNVPLRDLAAYQKLDLFYLKGAIVGAGNRHVAGRHWYFATKKAPNDIYFPALNSDRQTYPVGDRYKIDYLNAGLGANTDPSMIRTAMSAGKDLAFVQTAGQKTFTVDDDKFTLVHGRDNIKKVISKSFEDPDSEDNLEYQTRLRDLGHVPIHDFSNSLGISVDNNLKGLYVNGNSVDVSNLPNRDDWSKSDIIENLDLNPGLNVIAIQAKNANSWAGLFAQLNLPYSNMASNESWKVSTSSKPGWTEVSYDDSDWADADRMSYYGEGPWGKPFGEVSNFDGSASWIWSAGNSGPRIDCRSYFSNCNAYFRWHVFIDMEGWKVKTYNHSGAVESTGEALDVMNLVEIIDGMFGLPPRVQVSESSVLNMHSESDSTRGYDGDSEFFNTNGQTIILNAKTTFDIHEPGCYSFSTRSKDGSTLSINDYLVVDNDGNHDDYHSETKSVRLDAGTYEAEVVYFGNDGEASLEVSATTGVEPNWNKYDYELITGGQELKGGTDEVCHDLNSPYLQ
jgi:hypothetical protein